MLKSQLSKLGKKYNESLRQQRKQDSIIEQLKKEKFSLKKELIESKYQEKQNELLYKNSLNEVSSLKNELKVKGTLIMTLEKERRKLETEVTRIGRRESRSRERQSSSYFSPKTRSISADRLQDTRRSLGRQLIQTGQGSAYAVTTNIDTESMAEGEIEKVVMLTRLLLSRTRLLADRDVQIQSLVKEKTELSTQVSRLKRTKYLAEELTQCRHRLAVKSNQLDSLIDENEKNRNEVVSLRTEIAKLRNRLNELYTDKNQHRRTPSRLTQN